MILSRRKRGSLFGKIIAAVIIVTILWLVIVFAFPFFEGWVYLKFFLLCVMGLSFLGITYLLRT
jgi:hypothetical protein